MKIQKATLYALKDLEVKNGKIDFDAVIGCIENWAGDMVSQCDNRDIPEETKRIIYCAVELFAMIGSLGTYNDVSKQEGESQ